MYFAVKHIAKMVIKQYFYNINQMYTLSQKHPIFGLL